MRHLFVSLTLLCVFVYVSLFVCALCCTVLYCAVLCHLLCCRVSLLAKQVVNVFNLFSL